MTLFKIAFVLLMFAGLILGMHELWKKSLTPTRLAFFKRAFQVLMSLAGAVLILSIIVSIF
jgi:hypothetical protein